MPEYAAQIRFIVNILFFGIILAIIYAVLRLVLPLTLPFLIGLIIAFVLKPVTAFLTEHTPFRRKAVSLMVIALFYIILFSLGFGLCAAVFSQFGRLLSLLPELYTEGVEPIFDAVNTFLSRLVTSVSPSGDDNITRFFDEIPAAIRSSVHELSSSAVNWLTELVRALPLFLTTFVFTIISSILISADYASVTRFLLKQLPPSYRSMFLEAKDFMVGSLFRMLKAYLLILLITASELAIGLWLLKVDLFLALAVLIALLDTLPLFGTGSIMIPWGILELARGSYALGIGLILLTAIVGVVRNFLEPRIVGGQIGLHPIVTIASMYLGLRLFGFFGLTLAPLAALLIKYLNDNGKIRLYK